jgi:hypothetical protein
VKQCGIEPFNEHIFSDHRSLFIDFDKASLFGSQAPLMASKNLRRLQSHNLAAKGAYLLSLDKYCTVHKVFTKIHELELQEAINWKALETLDQVITRGMLHAEKSCCFCGQDPWSPKLSKACMKVEILKLAMSHEYGLDKP